MGCKSSVKQIEEEMFMLELKKSRIQEKRVHMMTEFRFETGSQLIRPFIPDYIDHNYMRKKRGLKMFKKFKKGGRIVLEEDTKRRNEQEMNKERRFKGLTVSEDGDKEEEGNKNVEIIRRMMEKKGLEGKEKDKEEGNVNEVIDDNQKKEEIISVLDDNNIVTDNDNHDVDNKHIEKNNNNKSNIDNDNNNNPNVETKKFNLPSPSKTNNNNP